MTNTQHLTATTAATIAATELPALFERSLALAIDLVEAITPDQLHLPTPCDGYDVERMLAHLVFAIDRAGEVGRGDPLAEVEDERTSDEWPSDVRRAAAEALAAWADPARLDATVELPWATMTGAQALGVYIDEVTVHSWDIATATGHTVAWDDEVIAAAMEAITRELPMPDRTAMWQEFLSGMPGEVPFDPPFANATDVSSDAAPIDRLVAWTGRRPA